MENENASPRTGAFASGSLPGLPSIGAGAGGESVGPGSALVFSLFSFFSPPAGRPLDSFEWGVRIFAMAPRARTAHEARVMRTRPLLLAALSLVAVACADAQRDDSATHRVPARGGRRRRGGGRRRRGDGRRGGASASSEIPPTTAEALDTWLATRAYASWTCESAPHASRPPSGHATNRICSNRALSTHEAGEYPIGAASVKELFDDAGNVTGHAVATKVAAGGGESWYWYEKIGDRVIAAGVGTSGTPKTVCTRCHLRAGDATFGHDLVFTQVR